MVIGVGDKEYFIASDATPFIEYTNQAIYLEEEEVALISLEKGIEIRTIANKLIRPYIQELALEIESIEKATHEGNYKEKELFNLQCWALTCKSFLSKNDWKWLFNKRNFSGFYELIYFLVYKS